MVLVSVKRPLGALRAAAALSVLAFGLLVVLVGALLAEGRRNDDLRTRRDQAIDNRAIARRAFSLLQEAEIGQLRYLATGDPEFLKWYEDAAERLPDALAKLRGRARDTSEASPASDLHDLGRAELSALSGILDAHRSVGPAGALELERQDQRRRQLFEIRRAVAELIEADDRAIETFTDAVRTRTARFERITISLAVVLGGIFLAAAAAAGWYVVRRNRSEEDLKEARGRAEAASRAKTEFLAAMSHEIRTPLNGVIGYTELLLDQDLTPEQRRLVERIQFAGAALLTIVNDILDFSKIEAGRISLNPAPFSLDALLDNTVSIISELAERKGLTLQVSLDPRLPKGLLGDEARLRQILLNLLNNAVKFTDSGSVTLEVRCDTAQRSCDRIRFLVKDTGIGIPPHEHKNLFRRFYQVHQQSDRQLGGTGLGLAISQRLVELMDGEIGFESEEGRGSTFWFRVPLAAVDEDVLSRSGAPTSEALGAPARILLVEDLEHNRDLARRILTSAGHRVDTVANGLEAVAAVQREAYDLVLMDVQMPVMDGVTATREIRKLEHPASKVPIIAMTANVLPAQVKGFAEAGMNDHVGKPFRRTELFQKINKWVRRGGIDGQKLPPPADRPQEHLAELRELMGPAWIASGLVKLRELIGETFGQDGPPTERQRLATGAHALVSHAALLGFLTLSRLCAELEEACAGSEDLSGAYGRASAQARIAAQQASEILRSTGRDHPEAAARGSESAAVLEHDREG